MRATARTWKRLPRALLSSATLVMNDLHLGLVRTYARASRRLHGRTGRNLPGLGWLLRTVSHEPKLVVHGVTFELSARDADCYARLVMGEWTEPETHLLLEHVLDARDEPVRFVDVGANVGEFVVSMAMRPEVAAVVAFEPIASLADAIERSLALNAGTEQKVSVRRAAVSSRRGVVRFESRTTGRNGSGVSDSGDPVPCTTLDDEVQVAPGELPLVLVDVEGHELDVLRGATRLLREHAPLMVLEYNHVTRRHFSLDELTTVLGPDYEVRRLRRDGRLDRDLSQTWNVVAIPRTRRALVSALFEG